MNPTAAAVCGICAVVLVACSTTPPPEPTIRVCPQIVAYTPAEEAQASAELKALPTGAMIGTMIVDYGGLRAQIRAACP